MQKGIVIGIVVVALLLVVLIGYNALSNSSDMKLPAQDSQNSDSSRMQESQSSSSGSGSSVSISGFAFSSKELRVSAGTTVTWNNDDSAPHTVTSDSGSEMDSATLNKGQTYSHTFNQKGIYSYHCTIHPG